MKELSIEQKAKAYDEAIKRIQSYVVDEYGCTRIKVVNVFPELKESEDEKIRKEIIRIVDGYFPDKTSIQRGKYIAWLEKQGENILIEEIKRRKELYSQEKEKVVSSTEKLSLGGRIAMLEELLVFVKEKQGEQKPNPILDIEIPFGAKDSELQEASYHIPEGFHAEIDGNRVVIKRGKQKPTKFHKGDWVMLNENHNSIYQVEKIENYHYVLRHILGGTFCIPFGSKNSMRLWTIQDAKDGDVLNSYRVKATIIFKGWNSDGKHINAYCALQQGILIKQEMLWDRDFEPATKEQCKRLFQKMKEEGYEWDAGKKELNKL